MAAAAARAWKREVQRLADDLGLSIEVHPLPPGTSKWNKIEPCLFSFIRQTWRAKPLIGYGVSVKPIAATTTSRGLKVPFERAENNYPKGSVIPDAGMAGLNIQRADFHGEWNDPIAPSNRHNHAFLS